MISPLVSAEAEVINFIEIVRLGPPLPPLPLLRGSQIKVELAICVGCTILKWTNKHYIVIIDFIG